MIYIDKESDKDCYSFIRRYAPICGAGCEYVFKIYRQGTVPPIKVITLMDKSSVLNYSLFVVDKGLLDDLDLGHYTFQVFVVVDSEEVLIDRDMFYIQLDATLNKELSIKNFDNIYN